MMPESYMDRICPQGDSVDKQPHKPADGSVTWVQRTLEGPLGPPLEEYIPGVKVAMEKIANKVERAVMRKRNGTVVFDIDGVLADSRWRLDLIRRKDRFKITLNKPGGGQSEHEFEGPRDEDRWEQFYGLMGQDVAYEPGVELLRQMRRIYNIEFWTGRPERFRDLTVKWLIDNDLLPGEAIDVVNDMSAEQLHDWSKVWLCMRPDESRKPAHQLKTNYMLALQDEDIPNPVLVIDDDPEVVYAFGLYGVPSLLAIWHGEGVERVRG